MTYDFFKNPIINSPYAKPKRHWELDESGQPSSNCPKNGRRRCELVTPVPTPKAKTGGMTRAAPLSGGSLEYDPIPIINEIRSSVDSWRCLPNPNDWKVTPETSRLLQHWRQHRFQDFRPFFCQVEAIETAIWLTEVAPKIGPQGKKFLAYLNGANDQANPELFRMALKLCTGAGKTAVMAMMIAWQTVNAARRPTSHNFTRGFLIVAPGITIRDRLRVLLPNDPDSYYKSREIVPPDMLGDIGRAKIVITNYHAFKLRERFVAAKNTRRLIEGRGPKLRTLETESEMIRRVMSELMNMKNIVALNDEAHHCYRERPDSEEGSLKGEEKAEAEKNNEAARLWITGLETVGRKLGLRAVYDLSATPFFLSGSGYREGTLFPWTVSDFSLMDGIESGIVKLPRVPIADNIPGEEMPKFRNLWEHIGRNLPQKGRSSSGKDLDPLSIPTELQTALEALYGHYEKTFRLWEEKDIESPPVFIVVCNNTATSKLVYDYISGFQRKREDGKDVLVNGKLALFRNFDESGNRLARPRTLLIDSEQLESGDALDKDFRKAASEEIERFRREKIQRTGDINAADKITDQDLLREVMNTVGKIDTLGESIRCVVSVSMLTEGWDANTVTHILGVRAFGTQLLCEQVVGRALRRLSYQPSFEDDEDGRFDTEYADILGIPFDFAAKPTHSVPKPPAKMTRVHAVSPERDLLKIDFPRVAGYRVNLPKDRLSAAFSADSILELTPELVGPTITRTEGIIGEGVDLTLDHLDKVRPATLHFHLAKHLMINNYRNQAEEPKLHLFGQFKRICRQWLDDGYLRCSGGTYPAQLMYLELANLACEKIAAGITAAIEDDGEQSINAILDAFNPIGSTADVNFTTSKDTLWRTDPRKSHLNFSVCDSKWEMEFARVAEAHPRVISYVKNYNLGLEVPYLLGGKKRIYIPDYILRIDDGRNGELNLIVEIKGYRNEDAAAKAETMRAYWVPGVNKLPTFGRWEFIELTDPNNFVTDLDGHLS